jgi:hypothetical protein
MMSVTKKMRNDAQAVLDILRQNEEQGRMCHVCANDKCKAWVGMTYGQRHVMKWEEQTCKEWK